jgi:hypothetical protein
MTVHIRLASCWRLHSVQEAVVWAAHGACVKNRMTHKHMSPTCAQKEGGQHPTGPAVRVLDVVSLAMWASLWATSSVTVSDVMPVIRKVACIPPYTLHGGKRGMRGGHSVTRGIRHNTSIY